MSNTKKRENYISWDEYFMGIALLSAMRSKDPNTQVGACIVDKNNVIVGIGYNGFPKNCSDDELPWGNQGDLIDTKYPFVCHAELNAILNSIGRNLHGCKLYTALFPCNECAKAIIQSGIKEIVYMSNKYEHLDSFKASPIMFEKAGISRRKIEVSNFKLEINFKVNS